MTRSKWALFAFFSLALHPAATAQVQSSVRTAILNYAPVPLPDEFTAFYETNGAVYKFSPTGASLGVPVLYAGPRSFVLRSTREEFELPPEELKLKPPLAAVNLPASSDLVLIMAVPGQGEKIGLVAYDISTEKLKLGSCRVFNFSTQVVSMIMGDQKFAIMPFKETVVSDSKWNRSKALPFHIATVSDRKSTPVYSTFWEHNPNSRKLLFLFDGNHPSEPIVFNSFNAGTPPKQPEE